MNRSAMPLPARRPDWRSSPETGVRPEVGAHILIAMIMADLQTRRDRRGEGHELLADALADRFQGLETRGLLAA